MNRVRSLLSPSMIVAMLALLVALGGTSYAVAALPANSVGTVQLKSNAVTSAKVKDRSLLAKDFAAGQLPRGPQGIQGPEGPEGPQGPQGIQGPSGNATVIAGEFFTNDSSIFLKTVNFTVVRISGNLVAGQPAAWRVTMPPGTVPSGQCGIPVVGATIQGSLTLSIGNNICDNNGTFFEVSTPNWQPGPYIAFTYNIARF